MSINNYEIIADNGTFYQGHYDEMRSIFKEIKEGKITSKEIDAKGKLRLCKVLKEVKFDKDWTKRDIKKYKVLEEYINDEFSDIEKFRWGNEFNY